jgi:uncharacterized membrane protein
MQETKKEEKQIYELFKWSVILKGLISLAEIASGLIVLFIPTTLIIAFAEWLSVTAPAYGVPAFFVNQVENLADTFTHGTLIFVSFYLLSRGIIKTFLVWALLKNTVWAYPASLIVLGLFVVYQTYQIITTHSVFVITITVFDLIVIYFIWREYQIVKEHLQEQSPIQPVVR